MDLIDSIEDQAKRGLPNAFHLQLERGGALGFAGITGEDRHISIVAIAAEDPNEYYASVTMSVDEAVKFAKALVGVLLRASADQ